MTEAVPADLPEHLVHALGSPRPPRKARVAQARGREATAAGVRRGRNGGARPPPDQTDSARARRFREPLGGGARGDQELASGGTCAACCAGASGRRSVRGGRARSARAAAVLRSAPPAPVEPLLGPGLRAPAARSDHGCPRTGRPALAPPRPRGFAPSPPPRPTVVHVDPPTNKDRPPSAFGGSTQSSAFELRGAWGWLATGRGPCLMPGGCADPAGGGQSPSAEEPHIERVSQRSCLTRERP